MAGTSSTATENRRSSRKKRENRRSSPSPTSYPETLKLRLRRALLESHDSSRLKRTRPEDDDGSSPKSKQRRMDEGACAAASCDGEDDDNNRGDDGGDMHRIGEGTAAATKAAISIAAAKYISEEFLSLDRDCGSFYSLISEVNMAGAPQQSDVLDVLKDFIVVQEKDPKIILTKIDQILTKAARSSLEGNGYKLTVPLRSSKNLVYKDGYGYIYKREGSLTYDFSKNMHQTVVLTCVLSVIAETIRKDTSVTNRHLFYCYKDIFRRKAVSDEMIANVCCLFGCTKSSLRIVSESKGSVVGPLVFKLKHTNETLNCSLLEGQRIPSNLSGIESFIHQADCILVVEKKSMFHHLLQMQFHSKNKCILISGGGQPDIATRLFLKRLHRETQLQVYAFLDPDPHGVQILFVYAFGSENMSYDKMGLAVPSIKWIGLFLEDLLRMGIGDSSFFVLTDLEKKTLQNLLARKNLSLYWKFRIQCMEATKSSMEALFSKGLSYMSEDFLPKLI